MSKLTVINDVPGYMVGFRAIVDDEGYTVVAPSPMGSDWARLLASAPELLEALEFLASTARTFRNVPKNQQEWTSIDEDALNAAFSAIAKARGE